MYGLKENNVKCVLTNIELVQKCPVETCMYHSKINNSGCCADSIEDASLEELATHKGLDDQITKTFRLRKRAIERIHRVLLLDEFFQFTLSKPVPYSISSEVEEFLKGLETSLFKIKELAWSYKKLAKVMHQPYWDNFFKETKATPISIQTMLELSTKEFQKLSTFFKEIE